MRHRLYKLETKFTILGMGMFDLGVTLGAFIFSIQILGVLVHPRLQLVLAIIVTAVIYWAWHLVKDKVPDKFPEHFMTWLGEPEVYRCVPDTDNVPLVVDFDKVPRAPKRRGLTLRGHRGTQGGTLASMNAGLREEADYGKLSYER